MIPSFGDIFPRTPYKKGTDMKLQAILSGITLVIWYIKHLYTCKSDVEGQIHLLKYHKCFDHEKLWLVDKLIPNFNLRKSALERKQS